MLVVHVLVESVPVFDEHAALTEEAQQDVRGTCTNHFSRNMPSSYSQTSNWDGMGRTKLFDENGNMPRLYRFSNINDDY